VVAGAFGLAGTCVIPGTEAVAQTADSDPPSARGTLSGTDAQDLRHQMQIIGGPTALPSGGGWTILPRLDVLGMLTDNALQVRSPRQWDVISIVAPGIAAVADTRRMELRFDYSPIMTTYARTTSQNTLSHALNGTARVTIVPEEVFVDARATAGVQPTAGGFGGLSGYGLGGLQAGILSSSIVNSAVLNRDNQTQTFNATVAPYLTRQLGDYGSLRLGTSFAYSSAATVAGYGTLPFTTSGTNSQSALTTEQTLRYVTDEWLGRIQNTIDGVLSQTPMADTNGFGGRGIGSIYSSRQTLTSRTAYAINHALQLFVTLGYENITYRNSQSPPVKGLVWNLGTTYQPNADSSITVAYGRQEGANSLTLNGNYALTPRTMITASYSSRLSTQLQNFQRQLSQGVINGDGILVDSQTGAPLAVGNNGLAFQPGLFRYDTLNLGAQTSLDRDLFTVALTTTSQRPVSGTLTSATTSAQTLSLTWTHNLRPDLSLNSILSFTRQSTSGSASVGRTVAGSVGLNYLITDSLTGRIRYSYSSRSNSGAVLNPAFDRTNFAQNLFTVGITKQF
jgi:uncharacterized protein (PEP-CTERM system associated)